jgi:hypothetical protein
VPDRAFQKQSYIERSVISILHILVIAREKDERLQIFINDCNISSAQLEIHIMAWRTQKNKQFLKDTSKMLIL